MNEHGYIKSVNRHINLSWQWKVNDNFTSGIPDCFYEGTARDLWVEYKYIRRFPKKPGTLIDLTRTDEYLSKLQQLWLERRVHLRGDAWVICGSEHGGVIFRTLAWQRAIEASTFKAIALPQRQIASIINAYCNGYE